MKKYRKILSLVCLVCLLIPMLCGCKALDEQRLRQAFYDEAGDILWNGNVYKKLPKNDYFYPDTSYENMLYVTEPDVPVLLLDMFNEMVLIADDEGLILENYQYYDYGYGEEETVYYCRADRYDEMARRMKAEFKPDMVCYFYHVYDEETEEYVQQYYRLSDDEWGVLLQILEHVAPMVVGEGWELSYDESIYLEECSEDRMFCREFLQLMRCGDTYYMELNTGRETFVYQVPEEAAPHVKKIMEAEMESYFGDSVQEWLA